MVTSVLKRDNTTVEPFDPQKINDNILAAAKEAGQDEATAKATADAVSGVVLAALTKMDGQVKSLQIRQMILDELATSAPQVKDAWVAYEAKKNAPKA